MVVALTMRLTDLFIGNHHHMFLQFFFGDRAEGKVDENNFVGASSKDAEDTLKPSEVIFVGSG